MSEGWEKLSPESGLLPAANYLSPASAFWHQGQSGSAGHVSVRHCQAISNGALRERNTAPFSLFITDTFSKNNIAFECKDIVIPMHGVTYKLKH